MLGQCAFEASKELLLQTAGHVAAEPHYQELATAFLEIAEASRLSAIVDRLSELVQHRLCFLRSKGPAEVVCERERQMAFAMTIVGNRDQTVLQRGVQESLDDLVQ